MWNLVLVDVYDTRLTMGYDCEYLGFCRIIATTLLQLNHHGRKAGGVLEGGWNFFYQWDSF